jgi:hypothetical protein
MAFVAESFTREYGASDRNIERWKQAMQNGNEQSRADDPASRGSARYDY